MANDHSTDPKTSTTDKAADDAARRAGTVLDSETQAGTDPSAERQPYGDQGQPNR